MIRAISFAMYVVAPCVGVVGTRWALEWLAPGLSHPVKVALTIPPFILIMGTWPWPLPFWMTWDWVLHGSRANSIELMEMKRAESVITVFLLPILFLNFLSGIVGGVWLATIGQWFILATGLFLTLIGWFLVSLVLAPWYLLVTAVCAHQRLARLHTHKG